MAAQDTVGVSYSHTGRVAYPSTGVVTCGSVWACPVCSAKVRRVRTSEVEHVAKWHTDRGGKLIMMTLTLRHTALDPLGPMVEGLCEAWRKFQQSYDWRATRRDYLDGMIRALEVTHGFVQGSRNGWHPHLHVLGLVQVDQDAEWVARQVAGDLDAWQGFVTAELGERFAPNDAIGVDVRVIDADAAKYVAKISMEVTRGDLKSGARQPWSLIDTGRMRLWSEYCAAMKGRRAVQFSRGLRADAGLALPEDDERLMLLDLDEGVVVAVFDRRQWNRYMREGWVLSILDEIAGRCAAVRETAPPPDVGDGAAAAVAA